MRKLEKSKTRKLENADDANAEAKTEVETTVEITAEEKSNQE